MEKKIAGGCDGRACQQQGLGTVAKRPIRPNCEDMNVIWSTLRRNPLRRDVNHREMTLLRQPKEKKREEKKLIHSVIRHLFFPFSFLSFSLPVS